MIDQTYGKFVGIVARERKLDEAALRAGVADGRVVSGRDAVKEKLIDGTGSVEDAYKKAMELGQAKGAAVIKYESGMKLGKLLKLLGKSDHAELEGRGEPLQRTAAEARGRPPLLPARLPRAVMLAQAAAAVDQGAELRRGLLQVGPSPSSPSRCMCDGSARLKARPGGVSTERFGLPDLIVTFLLSLFFTAIAYLQFTATKPRPSAWTVLIESSC